MMESEISSRLSEVRNIIRYCMESVGVTAGEASAKSLESISAWMVVEGEGELGENEGIDGLPFFSFFLLGEMLHNF